MAKNKREELNKLINDNKNIMLSDVRGRPKEKEKIQSKFESSNSRINDIDRELGPSRGRSKSVDGKTRNNNVKSLSPNKSESGRNKSLSPDKIRARSKSREPDTIILRKQDSDTKSVTSNSSKKSATSNSSKKSTTSTKYRKSAYAQLDGADYKYDLASRPVNGPIIPECEKIYTPEEQAEMLIGYFKIPKERWNEIMNGSEIRYIRDNGKFSKGGYIKFNNIANNKLTLSNSSSAGDTFSVDTTTISEIYKKYYRMACIEIDFLVNSVKKLSEHIKQQEERIKELESIVHRSNHH